MNSSIDRTLQSLRSPSSMSIVLVALFILAFISRVDTAMLLQSIPPPARDDDELLGSSLKYCTSQIDIRILVGNELIESMLLLLLT